jgi:putative pyruvate formate lyase activating enzyme
MSEKTMKLLDGVVDMYLSDFKYGNNECAKQLSKVENYFEICARNHLLAAKQAELTIRHLVLPNHVDCCTKPVLKWIAENMRTNSIVNIMDQYRPAYKAKEYMDIRQPVSKTEIEEAINYAKKLKLNFVS